MNLRQKTLLLVLSIYVPLVVLVALTVRTVVLRGHILIEVQEVERAVQRVRNSLEYELRQLDKFVWDWASWDDTMAYAIGECADYEASTLIENVFADAQLALISLFTPGHELIFAGHYDHEEKRLTTNEALEQWLANRQALLTPDHLHTNVLGILNIEPRPLLIASRHILNSRNEGPSVGLFIMGRSITPDYIDNVRALTDLHFELTGGSHDLPCYAMELCRRFEALPESAWEEPQVMPVDSHTVAGSSLVPVLNEAPPLALCVVMPRDIYRRGVASVHFAMLAIALIAICFALILSFVLERALVVRMLRLSDEIDRLARRHEGTHYLAVDGTDELARVIEHINSFIQQLAARQDALTHALDKHRCAETEVSRAKEQLGRLTRHLQDAREQEQSRIAQWLHDELGQELMTLKIGVKWIEKRGSAAAGGETAAQLAHVLETVGRIEACVGNLVTELKPAVLDTFGLGDAIDWLLKRYAAHEGIHFQWHLDLPDGVFGPGFSTTVFRIVQEGLVNILRHAGATQVRLIAHVKGGRFHLALSDNGIGFSPDSLAGTPGFGIMQMRERTESLGGTIVWQRDEQGGTVILLTIPLQDTSALGTGE